MIYRIRNESAQRTGGTGGFAVIKCEKHRSPDVSSEDAGQIPPEGFLGFGKHLRDYRMILDQKVADGDWFNPVGPILLARFSHSNQLLLSRQSGRLA